MANELESNVEDFRGNAPTIDPNVLKEAMAVGSGQELPQPIAEEPKVLTIAKVQRFQVPVSKSPVPRKRSIE